MNTRNIIVIICLAVMGAFVGISLNLYSKLEKTNVELEQTKNQLTEANNKLERNSYILDSMTKAYFMKNTAANKDSASKIFVEKFTNIIDSSTKVSNTSAFDRAIRFEAAAFNALVANRFDLAYENFMAAEKASPSFHMAWEISNLLRKNNRGKNLDADTQRRIKQQIITSYSWGAPKEQLAQLKKQVRE